MLVQETHTAQEGERTQIRGPTLVAAQHHSKFGLATYLKDNLLPLVQVVTPENEFYTIIKIDEQIVVNLYKPPSMNFENEVLPQFEKPSYVGGDFNSHNPLWGYNDGHKVADWMIREDYTLLYNSTDPGTFCSARWNRSFTPDLCFVSKDDNGNPIPATRKILRGFPNSQHRPIIVEIGLKIPLIRWKEPMELQQGKLGKIQPDHRTDNSTHSQSTIMLRTFCRTHSVSRETGNSKRS